MGVYRIFLKLRTKRFRKAAKLNKKVCSTKKVLRMSGIFIHLAYFVMQGEGLAMRS
jgi:hypothetical protein